MYGIYFSYENQNKKHLIESFTTETEAVEAKEKYIISEGEKVKIRPIS